MWEESAMSEEQISSKDWFHLRFSYPRTTWIKIYNVPLQPIDFALAASRRPFLVSYKEKYAGKYSCTHKSTSASHEEMDIISQERLNLKAHVSVGFFDPNPVTTKVVNYKIAETTSDKYILLQQPGGCAGKNLIKVILHERYVLFDRRGYRFCDHFNGPNC